MPAGHPADTHPMIRQTRCVAIASVVAGAVLVAGCAASTHVELDSADAPSVALGDGAADQEGVSVIEAGAINADAAASAPTTVPTAAAPTTSSPPAPASTSPGTTAPGTTVPGSADAEVCPSEFARLTDAVDGFVEEYGIAPVSEGELVATGHLRMMSNVYDVWIDGSIRAAGDTCAPLD